jgi:SAM-dependent methyltransferase
MQRGTNAQEYYEGDYLLMPKNMGVYIYRQKSLQFFQKYNKAKKPLKLLDIGCHDGEFALKLRLAGYDVTGIDISRLRVANTKAKGIKAFLGSAEKKYPFKDDSFDAAFAGDIIEHLYDTDFFIKETRRILKPGGVFVITTPNLASLSNRVRLVLGKLPVGSEIKLGRNNAGHIRNYTFPALEEQLKEHKFKVIKKLSSNIIFPVKYEVPILRDLAIRMGDHITNIGSHIIMIAKKQP